eukprot:TRINITY_DN11694_c0_g2_i2.p1 TRINITY_DN11694_c0_g2~~TRINITY_DN11694_c0_g2_i2.p1  ORF type:complete len:427 (-),score=88.15 TRINITY_DN11694_c0_g2_i2:308-1588(-)
MSVSPGFPPPDPALNRYFEWNTEVKMIFWDPATRLKIRPQPMSAPCTNSTRLQDGSYLVAVTLAPGFLPTLGDLVTVSLRYSSRAGEAIPSYYRGIYNVFSSTKVETTGVSIYGGAGFGILEWGGGGGHLYRNITISRRASPPYPRRLLSTNLDGFHSFSVHTGGTLEQSVIAHMGDDFANVHNRIWIGFNFSVDGFWILDPGDALLCTDGDGDCFSSHSADALQIGDEIGVFNLTDLTHDFNVTVRSIRQATDPGIVELVRGLPERLAGPPWNKKFVGFVKDAIRAYQVTTGPLPPRTPGFAYMEFYSQGSAQAVVRDNYFLDSYDSCFRAQGSGLVIANNTFDGASSGMSVVVDEFWLEGSLGLRDVAIVGNRFENVTSCQQETTCFTVGPTVSGVVIKDNVFVGDSLEVKTKKSGPWHASPQN